VKSDDVRILQGVFLDGPSDVRPEVPGRKPVWKIPGLAPNGIQVAQELGAVSALTQMLFELLSLAG